MSSPLSPSILLAQAADAAPAPGGLFGNPMVFMVLMFVMMYFVLIRPQRNRQKQLDSLLKSLQRRAQRIVRSRLLEAYAASQG